MRVEKEISIQQINMDHHPINPQTLSLVDYLRSGGEIPAIKVQQIDNGRFRIKDGRHRITAFKLLGKQKIKAKYYERNSE